jgi:hypothetical protein
MRLSLSVNGHPHYTASVNGAGYLSGHLNMQSRLGDYKARPVKDQHWAGSYDSYRIYEFLFPDDKKRQFLVVGQSE